MTSNQKNKQSGQRVPKNIQSVATVDLDSSVGLQKEIVQFQLPQQDPNRFKAAKTFNFARLPERGDMDYLAQDTYIDAKDTVNNWCVAIVKNINHEEKSIKIGFEGWSSKYDIELKRNSSKIAPFRSHTLGYTGQQKTAYRDFKITTTYMAYMEKRVKEIIESNFLGFPSAYECTQFIRGELYYYVDSLLTLSLVINSEELPLILNFIELVYKLILKWYLLLPYYVPAWKENQTCPNLINVDLLAAVSMCGHELSQILGKVWGVCKRAVVFFQKFKADYIFEGPFAHEDKIAGSGFLSSLTNKFGSLQGFEKIVEFTQRQDIPLSLITQCLYQVKYIHHFVVPSESKQFGNKISQCLNQRLSIITHQELKDTDRDVMRRTIWCLEHFTRMYNTSTSPGQICETMELQIALLYLKSPFFELKIRSLSDFKNLFIRIQNKGQYSEDQIRTRELDACLYLNFEIFSQFLVENQIFEMIFTENPHPELIKRTLEILYIRTRDTKNPFGPPLIDYIWKCCTERHEAVARASFQVLQDLIQFMQVNQIEILWQRIKTLEQEEFDELRVSFLKQYTIGALHSLKKYYDNTIREYQNKSVQQPSGLFRTQSANNQKKVIPNIQSQNYLNLNIFWKIAQEENIASQKTKDFAMNALIEILPTLQNYSLQNLLTRLDFLKISIENLKQGISVHTTILFIRRILKTFPAESQNTTKFSGTQVQNNSISEQSNRERIIQYLIQEKIYDLVLSNAEMYMKSVQPIQEFGVDTKLPGSLFTHKDRIDAIINLIEFLIVNSKSSNLDFNQLQNFFNVFVQDAITPYENEQFFKFLTKENENSSTRERKYLLDEKRTTQVFQQIICNQEMLDCSKLGQTGFNCFKLLFLNVNAQTRMLDVDTKGRFTIIKLASLQGFDTLWQIVIFSKEQSVRDQARNFLVDLYLNYKVSDKKQITDSFLVKLDQIFTKLQSTDLHSHWLTLISTFIRRFDFENVQEQSLQQFDKQYLTEVQVTLLPQNTVQQVIVNQQMKIWQLIIQVGKAFNMRLSEFKIDTSGGFLDIKIYNDPIQQYNITAIKIRRMDEKVLDKELPRRIIAQNQQLINQMLDYITPSAGKEISEFQIQETFDLIELLPFNIENRKLILQEIQKIKKLDTNVWCQLFQLNPALLKQTNSLQSVSPMTCYSLILLQDLFFPKVDWQIQSKEQQNAEKLERRTFCIQFAEKGGLQFLIEFFNVISKENLQNQVLKCCAMQALQKLIIYFFSQLYEQISKNLDQQLVASLLEQNLLLIQSLTQLIKITGEASRRDSMLMEYTLKQVQRIILLDPKLINLMYQFPEFDNTLLIIYTQLKDQLIQAKVSDCIFTICRTIDFECLEQAGFKLNTIQEQAQSLPTFHFSKLIIKNMIPATLDHKKNTEITRELFKLANNLLTETEVFKLLHVIEPVNTIINNLAAMIKARPILEVSAKTSDEDIVVAGLMSILTNILAVRPQIKQQMQNKNQLIKYLMHECLFLKEFKKSLSNRNIAVPPKFKTATSRQRCLALIRELCTENESGIIWFVEYLRDEVFGNNVNWFWRTPRKVDWVVTAENKHERSSTGYVGLKNIGCICYMNSIIQQLYMIPSFRKAMLEVWDKNMQTEQKSENCLYQIKRMFAGLMQLGKQYYNPKKFCQSFKDIDGSPIDPRVQKDVDEFFNMLIDRIENLIKGTKEEAVMKNLMHGVFANELICKGCPHTSEREEPFMALQIQVKDKHSIQDGLDAFVQGEMLEGDNAYFCEKCDKKRDTLRRQTIKRLPNVLFLILKRFEFNFDTMSKFKINDQCEFPMLLDMNKYTQEFIKRQDLIREMEEKNLSYEELDQDRQAIFNKQQCPEYSQYNLSGIVVHQGTSENGHYYSFIKERESPDAQSNWFEFNDKEVTKFNPDNIPTECFGGEDPEFEYRVQQYSHDAAMQQIIASQGRIKTKNAYILIYERTNIIDQTRFHEFTDDTSIALSKFENAYIQQSQAMFNQCKISESVSTSIQIQSEIYHEIYEKNSRFWLTKHIFNKSFQEQAEQIFCLYKLPINQEYTKWKQGNSGSIDLSQDQTLSVYKFIISFLLTVAQRNSARGQIPSFVKLIRQALKNNVGLAIWLCETFSCQAIIKEFLIDCPIQDMSRFVAGLVGTAMQTVYQYEKKSLLKYIEECNQIENYIESTQGKFITQIINYLPQESKLSDEQPVYTPAEQVRIYKLNGSTVELPTLIILINSFLHYQGSPVMLDNLNFQMSAQFQRVICSFAELGPETSLYLLNTGCLLRILKLSLHANVELDQKMNQVPLFQIESGAKQQNIIANQTSSLDSKVLANDRRSNANSATSPLVFLVRVISIMIQQCRTSFQPQSDQQLYCMEKAEIELLVHEVSNRNWWKQTINEIPVARNAISKIWATLCTNDNQQSQIYLKQIFTVIQDGKWQVIKLVERMVLDFVNIEDAYQNDRINRVLNFLYEALKKNSQNWKTEDSLIELTYKLCLRCRMFAIELTKNKNITRIIEQITRENPSFPITQTNMRLFKDCNINWSSLAQSHKHMVTEAKVNQISNYSKQRLTNLVEILRSQVSDTQEAVKDDSDDDCYSINFKEGDLVDAKQVNKFDLFRFGKQNFQGWFTAEIIVSLDEMVRVKAITPNQQIINNDGITCMWIEKDSYKLAKQGSYTQNDKAQNHQFFCELFKLFDSVFTPNATPDQQISDTQSNKSIIRTQIN